MNSPDFPKPSLHPSFVPASKENSRVMTQVPSPEPHLGWHSRGYLPHWDHPGMIQSLNFRLADAMAQEVIERWRSELDLLGAPASRRRERESARERREGQRDAGAPREVREVELRRRIEEYLDAGYGACWLRRPEIAALVEGALLHFDKERYRLLAWCIMPNHVHALVETKEGWPLGEVLHSWKSYTSHEAGKILKKAAGETPVPQGGASVPWVHSNPGSAGVSPAQFWQREYLDRYVRNAEHYVKVIAYIEDNPVKAGLARIRTDWPWSSARFRILGSAGVSPAKA
jgi:REP element-mobilizing transposase RayT